MIPAILLLAAAPAIVSTPALGTEGARCRPGETGPAVVIEAAGLKDRAGLLRAELYPDEEGDFLADDNVLVAQHKIFRRLDMPLPREGPASLCLRLPGPGRYTLALLHDRNADHKFEPFADGIGFPGNPRLGWSRPPAAAARFAAGAGMTTIRIVLNYRRGLLSFGPIATGVAEGAAR